MGKGVKSMYKPAGIIKQMSLNGSVLIPGDLRDTLGWQGGTFIEIYPFEGFLVLRTAPEKEGLMREVNKALQGLDEDALRRLVLFLQAKKKKQGRSD